MQRNATRISVPAIILATIGLLLTAPSSLRANTITETFSLSVPTTALTPGGNIFTTTSFAEFNPADGTLNSITATLTGPATWSGGSIEGDVFSAFLVFSGTNRLVGNTAAPVFTGLPFGSTTINFNISETDTLALDFPFVTGTGTTGFDFVAISPGTTFSANSPGLSGTITYNFTPSASVPEPTTLTLLGTGLLVLAGAARRKLLLH